MEHDILPIESIQERDVDLILLEELSTNNAFCEWLINSLSLPELTSVNGAWRSISAFGLGETDILFSYHSFNKKIFVLIENKLDASFQNEQYNRYLKRANQYKKNSECNEAFTLLIAPKLYCDNQNDFENTISYETIADRLEFLGSKRNLFKAHLLKIATEKLRRGYQPINSIPVQTFWLLYWKNATESCPNLIMKKPDIVPHNSDWPMLYSKHLKNIAFYHKLSQGNVDATFKDFSEDIEFKLKDRLPDWAIFKKHGKSFSLRIFTGTVNRTEDFSKQIEPINNGLKNIEKLRNWIKANRGWIFEEINSR